MNFWFIKLTNIEYIINKKKVTLDDSIPMCKRSLHNLIIKWEESWREQYYMDTFSAMWMHIAYIWDYYIIGSRQTAKIWEGFWKSYNQRMDFPRGWSTENDYVILMLWHYYCITFSWMIKSSLEELVFKVSLESFCMSHNSKNQSCSRNKVIWRFWKKLHNYRETLALVNVNFSHSVDSFICL